MTKINNNEEVINESVYNDEIEARATGGCSLIPYVYVLTYVCMYIHYCTMHAAPHLLEYTDINTLSLHDALPI